MKIFKTTIALLTIITFTTLNAQEAQQIEEATIIKKYTLTNSVTPIDYQIKVETEKTKPVALQITDNKKTNQELVAYPNRIIKKVSIDVNMDGEYKNMFTVDYVSKQDDTFSITPSPNGFDVTVLGKHIFYNVLNPNYSIDRKSNNEFNVIVSSK